MNDKFEKAIEDAKIEVKKIIAKYDYQGITQKYIEVKNDFTVFLDKNEKKDKLSATDVYEFKYYEYMEKALEKYLVELFITIQGYEKNKKGLWEKKNKGIL